MDNLSNKTLHLEQRMAQRGIRPIIFNLAIEYGCRSKAPHGAEYYYFSTKSIEKMKAAEVEWRLICDVEKKKNLRFVVSCDSQSGITAKHMNQKKKRIH
jgi:hypothetical protein